MTKKSFLLKESSYLLLQPSPSLECGQGRASRISSRPWVCLRSWGRGQSSPFSPRPAPWISIWSIALKHHFSITSSDSSMFTLYFSIRLQSHHQLEEPNFCCLHFVQGQNERGNEKIICFIVRQTARLRRSIVPRQNLLNLVITEWMTDSYQIIHSQRGVNISTCQNLNR